MLVIKCPEALAFGIDAGFCLQWQDFAFRGLPEEIDLSCCGFIFPVVQPTARYTDQCLSDIIFNECTLELLKENVSANKNFWRNAGHCTQQPDIEGVNFE